MEGHRKKELFKRIESQVRRHDFEHVSRKILCKQYVDLKFPFFFINVSLTFFTINPSKNRYRHHALKCG